MRSSLSATFFSLVVLLSATLIEAQRTRKYTVVNRCPSEINLYIGGNFDGVLPAAGGTVERVLPAGSGFFYTDANGGNSAGAATRAGFFEDYSNNSNYYYIVKDVTAFNTGITITPSYPPHDGLCGVASCTDAACPSTAAYTSPPTRFPPGTNPGPPPLPLFACPHAEVSYTITFCPAGVFPGSNTVAKTLHPNGNAGKCMDVRGNVVANGTPVQIYDCNGTGAQKWFFNTGSTKVRLANTNFCLDAGSNPGNGVGMKIWQCYDNLPAQQWSWGGEEGRMIVWRLGQCLDLRDGNLANWNQLQTWQCTPGNTNQMWTVGT